ncbi:hypothetical protein [Streptomyces sp. MS2.AVA.5]|uniref:Uncharacterized protein n=1 Tax=Streptomyces achmelvichensis TaxID=3134111 RepID=A0ACC6Q795_9ACTN
MSRIAPPAPRYALLVPVAAGRTRAGRVRRTAPRGWFATAPRVVAGNGRAARRTAGPTPGDDHGLSVHEAPVTNRGLYPDRSTDCSF